MSLTLVDVLLLAIHQHADDQNFNLSRYIFDNLSGQEREVRHALSQISDRGFAYFMDGHPYHDANLNFQTKTIRPRIKDAGSVRALDVIARWTTNEKLNDILQHLSDEAERQTEKTGRDSYPYLSASLIRKAVFHSLVKQKEVNGLCQILIRGGDVSDATSKDGIDIGYIEATDAALLTRKYNDAPAQNPVENHPRESLPIEFQSIIDRLDRIGQSLEKTPKSYLNYGEPDFRNYFMNAINSAEFDYQVVGEAFYQFGKTDLLFLGQRSQVLGLAECKIWRNPKGVSEAIDQLFRLYTTVRTGHTILMVFIIGKGTFTEIIDKSITAVKAHELYSSGGEVVVADQRQPKTSIPFIMKHPADPQIKIPMQLMLFNFSNHPKS